MLVLTGTSMYDCNNSCSGVAEIVTVFPLLVSSSTMLGVVDALRFGVVDAPRSGAAIV
jgi:hypothetical protein